MLLIYPPTAKPSEPPAGLARLAGFLKGHDISCKCLDTNIEALHFLLQSPVEASDTWSRRAHRNVDKNLANLRSAETYKSFDRYSRAVVDLNRVLEKSTKQEVTLSLANYQEDKLSPLKSQDLIVASKYFKESIYFPYFNQRLPALLEGNTSEFVGISLNYISQAITTFSMIGYIKKLAPTVKIIVGGGLITSWMQNPEWQNPFGSLIDFCVSGPGEKPLIDIVGKKPSIKNCTPCFDQHFINQYLSPGFILPYAASSGCYWNKCSFCPEKAEDNPYHVMPPKQVISDIDTLCSTHHPSLVHFLDNAVSPSLMKSLIQNPLPVPWYGFARVDDNLTELSFCQDLQKSGCIMLKLGIESGDQCVLDAMNKGIDIEKVSKVLHNLRKAKIATYVYLLFGTPTESLQEARHTLDFVIQHHQCINFLNLAIFNMPVCSSEAKTQPTNTFYEADLTLYTDFEHPRGWGRAEIRKFLDNEFKRHPLIRPIILNDPPHFTSNHAPFFTQVFHA